MSDFLELLERSPTVREPQAEEDEMVGLARAAVAAVASVGLKPPADNHRAVFEGYIADIDLRLSEQLNLILHHPDFQRMEASWRGLWLLVEQSEGDRTIKVRALSLPKRELSRTLRKFRGTAWDQSPLFKKIYDEEFGTFGGEPYGVLIGDYEFDHRPEDVQLLAAIAQVAAVAHAPFIAAASPTLLQMESWVELANPRDATRIFTTPEYASWRALREGEDARYVGLCLPRFLARLPYGARTEPVEFFDFEEDVSGPDTSRFLWGNPAFAMGANIMRAFHLYGWCVRIRGVDGGGVVEGLPLYSFPTADGQTDLLCATEIALSERRESELALAGLIPLTHRKGTAEPVFVGAPSLQKPSEYEDEAATANAAISARLPYMFATCRFAHYLKCMARDKVGSSLDGATLTDWLQDWLRSYVDGSPERSTEEWRASHPLMDAKVELEPRPDAPGHYDARFYLRPHYQLEGMTAILRVASRVAGT